MNYTLDFRQARQWISLTDEQWNALEKAAQQTITHPAAAALLEKDLLQLTNGNMALASTEEERVRAYGEPLHLLHPALVLICRLPWLVEQYQAHGIDEQVLRDSLTDLPIWMQVCKKRTGHPGLLEYGWLAHTFTFRLFRLDRLQFIADTNDLPAFVYRHKETGVVAALCPEGAVYYQSGDALNTNGREHTPTWTASLREDEGFVIGYPILPNGLAQPDSVRLSTSEWELVLKPGDRVLGVHIPEGEPMTRERVDHSLAMASDFFKKHLNQTGFRALVCESWLLDDSISQIQPQGNISYFQQRFHRIPLENASDWQTRERAFADPKADILTFACRTSLQKSIAAWYRSGRRCRNAGGFILL